MKKWISAARLRTLPLALSSIFMGSILAFRQHKFSWDIFGFACLTTILLQVLSNFANDYGDTQNGADLTGRVGPVRTVQSGEISPNQMMKGIIITGILSLISGIFLLYLSFGSLNSSLFLFFLALGISCILAAYFYTAGKKPYGYMGLGDVSVFVFFGLVGVLGSCFLYTHNLQTIDILPAIAIGLLATGVLNLNNIRDIHSDLNAGKITIPVRIGKSKAILYHWFLLVSSVIATLIYAIFTHIPQYYYLLAFALILFNGFKLNKAENPDPLLKTLALTSLAYVILMGISIL